MEQKMAQYATIAGHGQTEAADRPTANSMVDAVRERSADLLPRLRHMLEFIENQAIVDNTAKGSDGPKPIMSINLKLMGVCDNIDAAHRTIDAIEAALGV